MDPLAFNEDRLGLSRSPLEERRHFDATLESGAKLAGASDLLYLIDRQNFGSLRAQLVHHRNEESPFCRPLPAGYAQKLAGIVIDELNKKKQKTQNQTRRDHLVSDGKDGRRCLFDDAIAAIADSRAKVVAKARKHEAISGLRYSSKAAIGRAMYALDRVNVMPHQLSDESMARHTVNSIIHGGNLEFFPSMSFSDLNHIFVHLPSLTPMSSAGVSRVRSYIARCLIGLAASWRMPAYIHHWISKAKSLDKEDCAVVRFDLALAHAYLRQHGYTEVAARGIDVFNALDWNSLHFHNSADTELREQVKHARDFHLVKLSIEAGRSFSEKPLGEVSGKRNMASVENIADEAIGDAKLRKNLEGISWMTSSLGVAAIDMGDIVFAKKMKAAACDGIKLDPDRIHPSTRANEELFRISLSLHDGDAPKMSEVDGCLSLLGKLERFEQQGWLASLKKHRKR